MTHPAPIWRAHDHRRRVIISTDAANEADDQFAITHALLSPSLDIRGIVAAHFGSARTPTSMLKSRAEIEHILDLTGVQTRLENGAPAALADEWTPIDSAAARLIIDEAYRSDEPLFVSVLGPLTDMASAILLDPGIAERPVTVLWIGGPPYNGTVPRYWPEFNLANDIAAANVVLASGIRVWQVTMDVYGSLRVGYAELERRVRPHGHLGAYLVDQFLAYNAHRGVATESRSLGDNPGVGLVVEPEAAVWIERDPVRFCEDGSWEPSETGGRIRVAVSVDSRFILEDLFSKLELADLPDSPRS